MSVAFSHFTGCICQFLNWQTLSLHPLPAKLFYLNFHQLKVVSRYPDAQLQVGANYLNLFNGDRKCANVDV